MKNTNYGATDDTIQILFKQSQWQRLTDALNVYAGSNVEEVVLAAEQMKKDVNAYHNLAETYRKYLPNS